MSDYSKTNNLLPFELENIIKEKYQVIRMLNDGLMGPVYLANDLKLNRKVVIKTCLHHRNQDGNNLKHEATSLTRLSNPHIVKLIDFDVTGDGDEMMVLEYITGETLEDVIEREGPLPVARALNILKQLAMALTEAHGIGLTHCDIKPSNIMLLEVEGVKDFVKLLDFGVAKCADSKEKVLGENNKVKFMGTPLYIAPEQVLAPQRVCPAADVYSLGLLLYYMLTKKKPASGLTTTQVLTERIKKGAPRIDTRYEVPKAVVDLYEKMTSKNLHKRPPVARVIEAIDAILNEITGPVFVVTRKRGSGWLLAGIATVLLALIAAVVLWPGGKGQEERTKNVIAVQSKQAIVRKKQPKQRHRPVAVSKPRKRLQPAHQQAKVLVKQEKVSVRVHVKPSPKPKQVKKQPERTKPEPVKPQKVTLITIPSHARVMRKGKILGRTPFILRIKPGRKVVLDLALRGYKATKVTIGAKRPVVTVKLKRIEFMLP